MTSDEQRLRDFRWNILQAWDRGGDSYIRNTIASMVRGQNLDVDLILKDDAPRSPVISPYAEPRCEVCKFCKAPGRCHRFPPQITFDPDPRGEGQVLYVFPKVWYSEWCGEFQLDQSAVDAIEASTKQSTEPRPCCPRCGSLDISKQTSSFDHEITILRHCNTCDCEWDKKEMKP